MQEFVLPWRIKMRYLEKWIWLNSQRYPDAQNTKFTGLDTEKEWNYTVAEFKKTYSFDKKIVSMKIRFSGDTEFRLFCDGKLIATGPISVGGDFLGNDKPRGEHYASTLTLTPNSEAVEFFAQVKLQPVGICEYSKGHGGFMLTGWITFDDGTETVVTTDRTWLARRNGAYLGPHQFTNDAYDSRIEPDEYSAAEEITNLWHCDDSPIPLRSEEVIVPGNMPLRLAPGEKKEFRIELDKIYAGFIELHVHTAGELKIRMYSMEIEGEYGGTELCTFDRDTVYRGFQLYSIGGVVIHAENDSDDESLITPHFITTCYPVEIEAKTRTSDCELNDVLDVCAHTLKYCRQMIHLDSPKHGEPLACTGDYYIESMMTLFSFGDMRLAEFDVVRTAELIRNNGGRMFHTTYSMIWVQMLHDIYLHTGRRALLEECRDSLVMLLNLFETYIGDNGLIENPPDYMFIDWIFIDGISLHHPPKALGQTCLNMYYYGALKTASKIFSIIGSDAMADKCARKADGLKKNINELLFDKEKNLYFEGLNTPTPEYLIGQWMPQNVDKRYYRKHANILAAYFGICERDLAAELLERAVNDDSLGGYQPYFAHFLLEAIYRNGLCDKYTLDVIEKWKAPVKECGKGLAEGFIPPNESYHFDHSHAWGGTPLYSLPKALTGIEVLEPGYKKISLSPNLMGLESATIEIPTDFGMITVELKQGCTPRCKVPCGIEVEADGVDVVHHRASQS